MSSCSKDESTLNLKPESHTPEYVQSSISKITLTSITGQTYSMLSFQSVDVFKSTISELEIANQIHIDNFISLYGNLSADSLDAKTDEVQFNEQEAYTNFENQFAFSNSMRKQYVVEELLWLENDTLDVDNHPFHNYSFDSEEMTLISDDGLVKIGTSLFYTTNTGFVEALNGDITIIEQFIEGDSSVLINSNIVNGLNKRSSSCKRRKGKSFSYYYSNYKKVVITGISFRKWPWMAKSVGGMVSYKKRWFGNKWRKHWQKLRVSTQNYFYNGNDCEGLAHQQWKASSNSPKWSQKVVVRVRNWGFFSKDRVKNGVSIYGSFYFNSSTQNYWLTW